MFNGIIYFKYTPHGYVVELLEDTAIQEAYLKANGLPADTEIRG